MQGIGKQSRIEEKPGNERKRRVTASMLTCLNTSQRFPKKMETSEEAPEQDNPTMQPTMRPSWYKPHDANGRRMAPIHGAIGNHPPLEFKLTTEKDNSKKETQTTSKKRLAQPEERKRVVMQKTKNRRRADFKQEQVEDRPTNIQETKNQNRREHSSGWGEMTFFLKAVFDYAAGTLATWAPMLYISQAWYEAGKVSQCLSRTKSAMLKNPSVPPNWMACKAVRSIKRITMDNLVEADNRFIQSLSGLEEVEL